MNSGYRLSYSTEDKKGGQYVPQKYMTCNKQNWDPWHKKCWYTGTVTQAAVSQGLSVCLTPFCDSLMIVMTKVLQTHLLSTLQSLHNSSADTQIALEVPVWCPEYRKCHKCWLCYQATMQQQQPLWLHLNRHLSETDGMGIHMADLQMLNSSSLECELYALSSIWITCWSVSTRITCRPYQHGSHAVSIKKDHMLSVSTRITWCQYQHGSHAVSINMDHMLSVSIWITCCQYQYGSHAASINMDHMLSVSTYHMLSVYLHLAKQFLLKNHH
jgi:hypothetical protein